MSPSEPKPTAVARLQLVTFLVLVLTTGGVVYATAHGHPGLLLALTQEDGPVEWLTALLLLAMGLYGLSQRPLPFRLLGILGLLGAGEEISWGQRLLGFETSPEILRRHNLQGEANLHNLLPSPTFNGLILITLLLFVVLYPLFRNDSPYAAGPELRGLFFLALAINHYRIESTGEGIGMAIVVLAFLDWMIRFRRRKSVGLMALSLFFLVALMFNCREVLRLHNHQYEIRELVIVMMLGLWCLEARRRLMATNDVLEDT